MRFGNILQGLMEKNNVSPGQFAQAMHISRSMLDRFTRNLWEPNFTMLKRIADYFHVSIDYLLDYHLEDYI